MKKTLTQQRSLFLRNALAFALIFLFLGLIVNQVVTTSLYNGVDQDLRRMATKSENEEPRKEIPSTDNDNKLPPELSGQHSFQSQVILWSKDGEILNKELLGNRLDLFASLKVNSEKLDSIQSIQLVDEFAKKMRFRSLTIASDQEGGAYVQFLSNTNQIEDTMVVFQRILIVCMIVFWLISLVVSYFLAKLNMKPIIASWEKQQQFVENSSHELRTPLTIIQGQLEKLFTKPSHTILEESESIALALNEVRRLDQLTKDLLWLARSDGNELVLDKQLLESRVLLDSLVGSYQEIAESQEKTLHFENNQSKIISADEKLIKQLLIIFLDNALKYTEPHDSISVISQTTTTSWVLIIEDTGIGIPEENQSKLFERFYREDEARQRQSGGYGLGLSIAKWIVDLHNGTIIVETNVHKGTRFIIELPY